MPPWNDRQPPRNGLPVRETQGLTHRSPYHRLGRGWLPRTRSDTPVTSPAESNPNRDDLPAYKQDQWRDRSGYGGFYNQGLKRQHTPVFKVFPVLPITAETAATR